MSSNDNFMQAIQVKYLPNSFRFRATCAGASIYTHRDDTEKFSQGYVNAANFLARKLGWTDYFMGGALKCGTKVFVSVGHVVSHVTLEIREYFDKHNGNTYCSFKVSAHYRDGHTMAFTSEAGIGRPDNVVFEAAKRLYEELVFCDLRQHPSSGGCESLSSYCERKGIIFFSSITLKTRLSQLKWEW